MEVPPTLLPLYKEKSQNNMAHVLAEPTEVKETLAGTQESWILVSAVPLSHCSRVT